MGLEGVEKFVATPELQSEDSIGTDPLQLARFGRSVQGDRTMQPALYRIEVTEAPGVGSAYSTVPPDHSAKAEDCGAELYARAPELVGDRNPREHEFAVQLRSFDAAKSAQQTGWQ